MTTTTTTNDYRFRLFAVRRRKPWYMVCPGPHKPRQKTSLQSYHAKHRSKMKPWENVEAEVEEDVLNMACAF